MTTGVRLSRRALSISAAEARLRSRAGGGIVVFAGRVRADRRGSSRVAALRYEVDRGPAVARLTEIERTARRRFEATELVLWHRLGRVRAGEVAVVVGACCAHRAEAFDAARYLIEELKATVPIWKEELGRPARRRRPHPGRPGARSAG